LASQRPRIRVNSKHDRVLFVGASCGLCLSHDLCYVPSLTTLQGGTWGGIPLAADRLVREDCLLRKRINQSSTESVRRISVGIRLRGRRSLRAARESGAPATLGGLGARHAGGGRSGRRGSPVSAAWAPGSVAPATVGGLGVLPPGGVAGGPSPPAGRGGAGGAFAPHLTTDSALPPAEHGAHVMGPRARPRAFRRQVSAACVRRGGPACVRRVW